MQQSFAELNIGGIRLCWRESPLFMHQQVIEITLPVDPPCDNPEFLPRTSFSISSVLSKDVISFQNPITSLECFFFILRSFDIVRTEALVNAVIDVIAKDAVLTQEEFDVLGERFGFNRPHPNIIVFRGDFTSEQNFTFITELIHITDLFGLGMYCGAETFGSSDKKRIPYLLSLRKIDEINLKLFVSATWNDIAKEAAERVLNSFTQCIAGLTHFSDENSEMPDLKNVALTFLFTQYSSLEVFNTYIRALYSALLRADSSVFDVFNIYLCYPDTTPESQHAFAALIADAFKIAIQDPKRALRFSPEHIFVKGISSFYRETFEHLV